MNLNLGTMVQKIRKIMKFNVVNIYKSSMEYYQKQI